MASQALFLAPVALPRTRRNGGLTPTRAVRRIFTTSLKLSEEDPKQTLRKSESMFPEQDLPDAAPPPLEKPLWKRVLQEDAFDDLRTFTLAFTVALLVRSTLIEPRYIPSLSMYPTFEVGDQFLVDKLTPRLSHTHTNDIVVFEPPSALRERGYRKSDAFIKRVVARAGDSVKIMNGVLWVNDEQREEEFINEQPNYTWGPAVVPEGMVMVLGDNRNNSYDSHVWGFLPEENIIGKAMVRYWPPARFGTTF